MTTASVITQQSVSAALTVVGILSNSRFPVYLAKSANRDFALKVFPFKEDKPSEHYLNETYFSRLEHPNIIKMVHAIDEKMSSKDGRIEKISAILMEYAQHGDLFEILSRHKFPFDEKLVRTYFRQIIEVLEYIHSKGIAHLDLKPENFLIGHDYRLKLIDFEMSYFEGDEEIISMGTKYYRAPEIISQECGDPYLADIFSAGIILFVMKTAGQLAQTEEVLYKGNDLWDLMQDKQDSFWELHAEVIKKTPAFFDNSFRELFYGMTRSDPNERWSLKQIKESEWYKGPTYTLSELQNIMAPLFR